MEDLPLRKPQAGEVAMKVTAVGLNRADDLFFHGDYLVKPIFPAGLGLEAIGTVTAVGPDVGPELIGKRFGTIPGFSPNDYPSLAEEAILPVDSIAELPPELSAVEGAAVWVAYGTAYGALVHYGRIGPGDFVIVTAASSSVGLAALQIVRAEGAIAIATTRTSAKRQLLLDLGAHHVIAIEEEDLVARVNEITAGRGARVAFDSVGGNLVGTLAEAVAPEGTIYLYGFLAGEPTVYPTIGFGKGIALTSFVLAQMKSPERLPLLKRYIFDRLADGTFKPAIDRVFPFEQTVDAFRYMESNAQIGKIVIEL